MKLALLNEILGRTHTGPVVFGCQAPDSGNAEILAHFGTPEQKRRFLEPLIAGNIMSCFSRTEPMGGSDPTGFTCSAVETSDGWVVNGEKWFTSHASFSSFIILMAVTDFEAEPHRRLSAFLAPTGTDGVEVVRDVAVGGHEQVVGTHAYVRYADVHLPADALLGPRGGGFEVAQVRLGGGRVHHAMRSVGLAQRAFEMMLERAVSRRTKGSRLADKQVVQAMIADSYAQIEQFRLLVLQTAWRIGRSEDYRAVRGDIAAVKMTMPRILHDVISNAIQVHGSLGVDGVTAPPMAAGVVSHGPCRRGNGGAQAEPCSPPAQGHGAAPRYVPTRAPATTTRRSRESLPRHSRGIRTRRRVRVLKPYPIVLSESA